MSDLEPSNNKTTQVYDSGNRYFSYAADRSAIKIVLPQGSIADPSSTDKVAKWFHPELGLIVTVELLEKEQSPFALVAALKMLESSDHVFHYEQDAREISGGTECVYVAHHSKIWTLESYEFSSVVEGFGVDYLVQVSASSHDAKLSEYAKLAVDQIWESIEFLSGLWIENMTQARLN